jgi:hypothetical protein
MHLLAKKIAHIHMTKEKLLSLLFNVHFGREDIRIPGFYIGTNF